MTRPTYTVIIPHYNTPRLLQRCLLSIPDNEDVQVIVVDDNSSPEKVDFNNFPGMQRKYTQTIFNKDSHGAGHARNMALPQATGKWLLFADADDFYTEEAWNLFDKYIDSDADIIYFGITSVDSDTMQPTDRYKKYGRYIEAYTSQPTEDNENLLRYRHDVPWGKMIRHELITRNQISFGETRYCNDTLFSCRSALAASSICVEPLPAYCVTDLSSSLTKQQSADAIKIRYSVICQKNALLRASGKAAYQTPILFYLRHAWHISPCLVMELIQTGNTYHNPWLHEIKRWLFQKQDQQ